MFIKKSYTDCQIIPSEMDITMMEYAIKLAQKAEALGEIPVGAVLVSPAGEIIGEGWNQSILMHDPTAHSEMMAIRMAGQSLQNYLLTDCTLYVTLEPCAMCAGAILHSRIGRLVFGASDYKTGAIGSRFHLFEDFKMNHLHNIQGGVLCSLCSQKNTDFFKKRRAINKSLK